MSEEAKFKIGDQWFYRGNRSPTWLFLGERPDGSATGISEKVPSEWWPLLEHIAKLIAENQCDACAGTGKPVSGLPCMCGGTGKMSDAARHLREQLHLAQEQLRERDAQLSTVRESADPFIRVYRLNAPLRLPDSKVLRDVLPGSWPRFGNLRKLVEFFEPPAADVGGENG